MLEILVFVGEIWRVNHVPNSGIQHDLRMHSRARRLSQINIVKLKPRQTTIKGIIDILNALLDLCSDEQLITRHFRLFDRESDLLFCAVGLGCIDMPQARVNGVSKQIFEFVVEWTFSVFLVPSSTGPKRQLHLRSDPVESLHSVDTYARHVHSIGQLNHIRARVDHCRESGEYGWATWLLLRI